MNKEPYKSPETKLYEAIFGAAEQEAPRKRLGAQQAIVTNEKEDLFTTAFYMGGKLPMQAIVDTGTDFNAVNGANCASCGSTYDIEGNLDSGKATLETSVETINYGASKFKGREATDSVCFTLGKCFDLDFLYVDEQDSLDETVGAVFGFARPN